MKPHPWLEPAGLRAENGKPLASKASSLMLQQKIIYFEK